VLLNTFLLLSGINFFTEKFSELIYFFSDFNLLTVGDLTLFVQRSLTRREPLQNIPGYSAPRGTHFEPLFHGLTEFFTPWFLGKFY
jgi:hypothetical protein